MEKRTGTSPLKALLLTVAVLWGLGMLAGVYVATRWKAEEPAVGPLLRQIQQMGQLHTVRYNMHDVIDHQRSLHPQGWLSAVPGVDRLYAAATRNTALVVADGGVEAGVDLSAVTPESVTRVRTPEGTRVRVRLPAPVVYTPDVRVRVVRQRSGLLWNDRNLIPDATEAVQQRLREAALQGDILAAAQKNAVRVLTDMARVTGHDDVEFTF